MNAKKILFGLASTLLALTSVAHLLGHFATEAVGNNPTENQIYSLITTYIWNVAGTELTLWQLFRGYSLVFAALLAFVGVLNLAVLPGSTRGLLNRITAVDLAFLGLLLGISLRHFPTPPTYAFALIITLYLLSLMVGNGGSQES
ncbi:MAG: hypothetical protein AAGD01_10375 [Acidobacteriota bacterium]